MPRRLHRRRLTLFLAVAACLVACPPAFAGPPTERLREFVGKVNAVIADPATRDEPLERVVRVRRLVAEIADMPSAAAAALGPEWETKTRAQREEFTTVFAEVLERAYVGRLAGAVRVAGSVVIAYRDEVVAGDEATVMTALRGLGGHDLRVDYRMTRGSGRWRVRDIVIDGVSTVENYRAQFTRILRRGAYAELLAHLRAKLAEDTLLFAKSPRSAPAIVSMPVAEPEVVAIAPAPAEPIPAVTPSRPIVRAPRDVAVAAVARPPRAVAVVAVARPPRAEPDTRRPEPIARRPQAAVIAAVAPMAAVPRAAAIADAPPPAVGEPDVLGAALGAVLLGLLGAGGSVVCRSNSRRRLWTSARAWRTRVAARSTRTARRPR